MFKRIAFISLFCSLLYACGGDAYQLQGTLKGLETTTVYAVFESPSEIIMDTTSIEEGTFNIRKNYADIRVITLYFNEKGYWLTVYPERGKKVKIEGDVTDPGTIRIKGGKTNNQLTDFRKKAADVLHERTQLFNELGAKVYTEKAEEWNTLTQQLSEQIKKFIKKNPNEQASAILINDYLRNPENTAFMEECLELLGEKIDKEDMTAFVERAKKTQVGNQAPDFEITDVLSNELTQEVTNGEYRILSFSNAFPEESLSNKTTFKDFAKTFEEDSVEIITVVLQKTPQQLREIIKKDTLNWNIAADSAGQVLDLIDLYNVNRLPFFYLIDQEGKIILKSSNDLDVKQKLKEQLQ